MQSISDTLLVTAHETWVEITLNRPDRLNSFNDDMHRALYAALTESRDTGMRAVLLTGAGRGFCAGQDLGDRDPSKMTETPDLSKTLTTFYNPLVRLIKAMECPVICAVNGVAAGAGANLALACDIVIASEKAKFIQSFAKVGLVPDSGGTWTLRHLIGEARAKALALTAEPVTATQAADWGMIWKALPEDEYLDHARALAAQFGSAPTIGLTMTKAAIQAAATNTLDEQLDLEAASQKICGQTPDYAEGVSAFLQKRAPNFTGKRS